MNKLLVFDYNFPCMINMGRQFNVYLPEDGFENRCITFCTDYFGSLKAGRAVYRVQSILLASCCLLTGVCTK